MYHLCKIEDDKYYVVDSDEAKVSVLISDFFYEILAVKNNHITGYDKKTDKCSPSIMSEVFNKLDFCEVADKIGEILPVGDYSMFEDDNAIYAHYGDCFLMTYIKGYGLNFIFRSSDDDIIWSYFDSDKINFMKMVLDFTKNFRNRISMEISYGE